MENLGVRPPPGKGKRNRGEEGKRRRGKEGKWGRGKEVKRRRKEWEKHPLCRGDSLSFFFLKMYVSVHHIGSERREPLRERDG